MMWITTDEGGISFWNAQGEPLLDSLLDRVLHPYDARRHMQSAINVLDACGPRPTKRGLPAGDQASIHVEERPQANPEQVRAIPPR